MNMNHESGPFVLRGKDAEATGEPVETGFLVRAGSFARKEIVPSALDSLTPIRQRLLAEGVLADEGGRLRFVNDYQFPSPSSAAAAILGRTANGWIEWKQESGGTLSEIRRVARAPQMSILDERKRQAIILRREQLLNEGKIAPQQHLDRECQLFRERFGPSVLAGMDGESLLSLMHDHSNRDSLVYWLEFKNDEEFDTYRFGSIAGGSAMKFRIFRRKETGNWQAAGRSNSPSDITTAQAVEIARTHRDQLVKGAELLEMLPENATDEDYAHLQEQMDELAPDVSRLAWGHKYFSLLFPDKLDCFHTGEMQRFHLLRLLQLPPAVEGRYVCAGRYVSVAQEAGIPLLQLPPTLSAVQGPWHRYWRVGTTDGKKTYWQMMRERNRVAVGWPDLGDISWVEAKSESRERLRQLLQERYPGQPTTIGQSCSQVTHFVAGMAEGDIVLAARGMTILGVGRVVGEYEYHPEFDFPHQRKVEWLSLGEWELPESREGLQSTVRPIGKYDENLLAIERRIQSADDDGGPVPDPSVIDKSSFRLAGIPGRIQSILDRKGQVILYGPPGTGKTYWAERTAHDLAAFSAFGKPFEALDEPQRDVVLGHGGQAGLVRICCFHPAYGYEDFLEGFRPQTVNGHVTFELRDGVFKRLCKDAASSPDRNFYLIVDEINRGDIPRIFGELLTTLEKDKRGKRIVLPLSQEAFEVPRNVFLLGTMNTADRSISLLDAALRRRFGFVEMMPDGAVLKESAVHGIPLRAWFEALNARIREHVGRDARNLQIGHSYLMHSGSPLKELAALKRALRDDIIPLLEEYCYEDFGTLGNILGEQLVDVASERIRHELFDEGQEEALIQGLLTPFPEIATSTEAITSEEGQTAADEAEDEEDEES